MLKVVTETNTFTFGKFFVLNWMAWNYCMNEWMKWSKSRPEVVLVNLFHVFVASLLIAQLVTHRMQHAAHALHRRNVNGLPFWHSNALNQWLGHYGTPAHKDAMHLNYFANHIAKLKFNYVCHSFQIINNWIKQI